MAMLNLSEIKDPVLELDCGNGNVKQYDLYTLLDTIEKGLKKLDNSSTTSSVTEIVRQAFDIQTLTHHQAQTLYAEVLNQVKGLDVTKKLSALTQS